MKGLNSGLVVEFSYLNLPIRNSCEKGVWFSYFNNTFSLNVTFKVRFAIGDAIVLASFIPCTDGQIHRERKSFDTLP